MTTRNDLSFITTGDGTRIAYRFDGTAASQSCCCPIPSAPTCTCGT